MGKASRRKVVRRTGGAADVVVAPAKAVEQEMSWAEIVETAGRLEEEWRTNSSLAWYRGLRDETYELVCTLHREIDGILKTNELSPTPEKRRILTKEQYKAEYRDFRSSAWPLLDQRERNDWGIVFAMQHYGQITRMLDWTESLACAAYFALEVHCAKCHNPNQNAAIWMLDPQALNQESKGLYSLLALDHPSEIAADEANRFDARPWHPKYGEAVETVLKTIAVAPDFTNPRMTAQRAAFTMSGDSFESLDKEFPKLVQAGQLRKFTLNPGVKKDAEAFLRAAGLDSYSFYPDLHGLGVRQKAKVRRRQEIIDKLREGKFKK